MKRTHITFPCDDIMLEGIWHLPENSHPSPAVIVCHPHPLYGGDMNNNVVLAICEALAEQGIATLRFNFRGVGNSGGKYAEGLGEQEDVTAAIDFTSKSADIDPQKIGLAGYSFGAGVAAPVAVKDSRVRLVALVSPALSESAWEQLKKYSRPKLLLSGDNDSVIPVARFRQHCAEMAGPKQSEVIPGADHFWQGYEEMLAGKVARFFVTAFQKQPQK